MSLDVLQRCSISEVVFMTSMLVRTEEGSSGMGIIEKAAGC